MKLFYALLLVWLVTASVQASGPPVEGEVDMQLGNFSVSLTVKDIEVSRDFYAKLGFTPVAGVVEQKWLIMQNGTTTIGLFQGMFDKNCLTFNPGWNKDQDTLPDFEDVRVLQERLKAAGITLTKETDPDETGPAHITLVDPDGNPILIDQHVPRPKPTDQ